MISKAWQAMALGAGLAISGCGTIDTTPINVVTTRPEAPSPDYIPDAGDDGSTVVALAFSGGGMRAAAWAYGALLELDSMVIDTVPYRRTLIDDVRTVAGTSGGAVTAAYLGYKGKDDYRDFRERFLYRNAEAYMSTSIGPGTLLTAAFDGGANDRSSFARWLDEKLFERATFSAFRKPDRPIVWLTASDIYNSAPFLFTRDTFAALCSDIDELKIADAVGASAAFPVVFAPMILQTPKVDCHYQRPRWMKRALEAKNPSIRLQAYARALDSYQSNTDLNFVRLLDGGLTDNLGITGLTLERAKADKPYAPLSPRQAVRLRNFLFVVTDAGVHTQYRWGLSPVTTRLDKVIVAASDTALAWATRTGFDAVDLALKQWQDRLVRYRCGLGREEVLKLRGTLEQWDCRDVNVTTEHISFREAAPELFARLNGVPTRLKLPRAQVDLVISAARGAVRRNANINAVADQARKHAPIFDNTDGSLVASR
ncbi:patatin-like phospholipase family protein [Manganibacter manganicus]|nr:patatin-like phospholipase family protein [Pseudaminobacter manganicus]